MSNNQVKTLWNFDIRTDHTISGHRPDIVVHDTLQHSAILLDIAVPHGFNIVEKRT